MAVAQGQGKDGNYWTGLVNEYPATVSVVKSLARAARAKSGTKSKTIRGFIGAKVSSAPEGAEAEENLTFTLPLSRILVVKQGEDKDEDEEMGQTEDAGDGKGRKQKKGGKTKDAQAGRGEQGGEEDEGSGEDSSNEGDEDESLSEGGTEAKSTERDEGAAVNDESDMVVIDIAKEAAAYAERELNAPGAGVIIGQITKEIASAIGSKSVDETVAKVRSLATSRKEAAATVSKFLEIKNSNSVSRWRS